MAQDYDWDARLLSAIPPTRLSYSVHSSSGHHAHFHPDNVLTPSLPGDDSKRWTAPSPEDRRRQAKARGGARRTEPEWICLELDEVVLLREVGFGKTTKPHPCNLISFALWGGPSPDPLKMEPLLLGGSLKNDQHEERVGVPIEVEGRGAGEEEGERRGRAPLPIKYLRIDCHQSATQNYSISIWHLFLLGHSASSLLSLSSLPPSFPSSAESLLAAYRAHLSRSTTHATLAHLRRAGPAHLPVFHALLSASSPSTRSSFEHPLLSALHDSLVRAGDWDAAERTLDAANEAGLFRLYGPSGGRGKSVAKWERLGPPSPASAAGEWPEGRAGHALVRVGRSVFLFGGWDGARDLPVSTREGGVWEWDLPRSSSPSSSSSSDKGGPWRRVTRRGADDGADEPGPRSCLVAVADEASGWVYVLGGRRDDPEDVIPPAPEAAAAGAMEVDPAPLPASSATAAAAEGAGAEDGHAAEDGKEGEGEEEEDDAWASDFWRFKAAGPEKGRWECLSRDTRKDGGPQLLFDHSLALHSPTQRLFVFGGKNQPYDPEPDLDDVLSGGVGHGGKREEGRYSGLWCYDIGERRWSHLIGDPRSTPSAPSPPPPYTNSDRLLSRAGHSLVLDPHPARPTLYILSGQRHETYMQDLWAVRLAGGDAEAGAEEGGAAEDEDGEGDGSLWRQGAVIDLPPPGSSSSSSAATSSRGPTILQIRRLWPPPPSASGTSTPASSATAAAAAGLPNLPPAAFTARLSLDPHSGDWTLLTGLVRSFPGSSPASASEGTAAERAEEVTLRGVWRKKGGGRGWKRGGGREGWERSGEEWGVALVGAGEEERVPRGRYASQVVYDPLLGEHYVFGGHPDASDPSCSWRLNDWWRLKIVDPSPEEALRQAKFLVRKQRFTELCHAAPTVLALQYLQTDLSAVVDHSSPSESAAFRACMAGLLAAPPRFNVEVEMDMEGSFSSSSAGSVHSSLPSPTSAEGKSDQEKEDEYAARHKLWEELIRFFPRIERQPEEDLEDTVRLVRVWKGVGTGVGAGGSRT
ncbi:hypothetical protein JCM8097_004753 [Rhodosporidiobolus ruineniae]